MKSGPFTLILSLPESDRPSVIGFNSDYLLTNSDYSVTVPHLGSIDFDYSIVLIPILRRIHIRQDPLAFD